MNRDLPSWSGIDKGAPAPHQKRRRIDNMKRGAKVFDLLLPDDDLPVAFLAEPWQSWCNGLLEGLADLPHERPFGAWHVART